MYKYLLFTMFILCACSKSPYKTSNKVYKKQTKTLAKEIRKTSDLNWVGTTNFGLRKPNFVVIHHTAQNSCAQTLKTFTLTKTQVSAHYVICRDGTVHQMLNDYLRAWHAGAASWGKNTDINSSSIGIELDNNGTEPFSEAQMSSLLNLCKTLKERHQIPLANFIGHADIAPSRKNDPSVLFDWEKLAINGYGKWFSDTTNVVVPAGLSTKIGLELIGYATKDSTAVLVAFKRKYLKTETRSSLSTSEMKILWSLANQ